jgi:RNA polymerase sigma-70 factor (ECF subfamily)
MLALCTPSLAPARRSARLRVVSGALAAPSDDETDGDLARRVMGAAPGEAGVAEALLVQRFSRRVFLYGVKHLREEDLATDLAQDVMTAVIERLRKGEVREPDRIGSFILGTARMMARDERRRSRRRGELAERVAAEAQTVVDPTEPLDVERLGASLAELSERERTVIVLTFFEDRTAAEIADTCGLSPGNVRVIRHRAIARLRGLMGLDEGGAP